MMPIMQLILLSYAANFEVKNLKMAIIDQDRSTYSQRLISKFAHIHNFQLVAYPASYKMGEESLLKNQVDLVMVIPPHFESNLYRDQKSAVQLMVNAIDGSKAGIANSYASAIINDLNSEILVENYPLATQNNNTLEITNQYWYNPRLEYRTFMVPGILFELLILVGGLISALNIVREKEIGTQEQLNVTPIKKYQFVLGKLIPFVVIGMVQFTMGLLVAHFIFRIPQEGSLALLYAFAFIFLILSTGIGLLISNVSSTLQQAMFAAFFMLVLFILLSGLFSSTENMPKWAQYLNVINPLKYIIEAGRNIMLKGSNWYDLQSQFLALALMAVGINALAMLQYRKTS
jgi:ABC-2 type transport system permease protein